MTYSQYQAALKAAGFTNITLDPQATTNQQADGYVLLSLSKCRDIC